MTAILPYVAVFVAGYFLGYLVAGIVALTTISREIDERAKRKRKQNKPLDGAGGR